MWCIFNASLAEEAKSFIKDVIFDTDCCYQRLKANANNTLGVENVPSGLMS